MGFGEAAGIDQGDRRNRCFAFHRAALAFASSFTLDAKKRPVNIRCPSRAICARPTASDPVMKMHHDTGPMPPNALAQETLESVRRALERYVHAPEPEPAPALRAALHDLAREARQKAIAPEQLLAVLKGIWRSLPDVENAREQSEQTRVLQQVVSTCIREYFAD